MTYRRAVIFLFIIIFISLVILSVFLIDAFNTVQDARKKALVEINDGSFITWVVTDQKSQSKGLSIFDDISVNQGMLFVYPDKARRFFWMKDMNFSIDIIWIDGDTVVGVTSDVPIEPDKPDAELTIYSSPAPVDVVLETKSGVSSLMDISVGDKVDIRSLIPGRSIL